MGRQQPVPLDPAVFGPGLDDAGCPILHVDMDAFFASVEISRDPSLRGKPVIVGGLGPRGVVAAANYEARRFGVGSAMPMSRARRNCPHAEFIEPHGRDYSRVSGAVMAMFTEYTPLVEKLSIDEAFLDVSGARRLFGSARDIAQRIRDRVRDEHGITCTVGVAANKFLAKLASTQAKPDGLAVVPADRSLAFLHPLPISALWGVGDKTAAQLTRLGFRSVGDIARATVRDLEASVGKAHAAHLSALARGEDARAVETTRVDKSVGAEVTFDADVDDLAALSRHVLRLCHKVAARARKAGAVGRTVSLKIRYSDFSTVTRSRTTAEPTDVARELYAVACDLVHANVAAPVRLIGVRLESLAPAGSGGWQPELGAADHGWRDLERTVDNLDTRFGTQVVRPASLLREYG